MNIRNLVVTGIVKFLRVANIDTLVVERVNDVTKEEIDTLLGATSNIQNQIESVSDSLQTAETMQTTWKGRIAAAVNAIPKPNRAGLSTDSALSQYEAELKKTQDAIEGATAEDTDVVYSKTYVNNEGRLSTGVIVDKGREPEITSFGAWESDEGISYLCGYLSNGGDERWYRVRRGIRIDFNKLGNAAAPNVLEGKTFTSKSGLKVTGTMVNHGWYTDGLSIGNNTTDNAIYVRIPAGAYLTPAVSSGKPEIKIPWSTFGNATVSDVIKGKTFTSKSGFAVTGTIVSRAGFYHDGTKDAAHGSSDNIVCGYGPAQNCWGVNAPKPFYYIRMPNGYYGGWGTASNAEVEVDAEIMNARIGLTANKIVKGNTIAGVVGTGTTGIDTSDANATASDIVIGKNAYVKGSKIEGTIVDAGYEPTASSLGFWNVPDGPYLCTYLVEGGGDTRNYKVGRGIKIHTNDLGNASADNVLSGKTFTSVSGIKVSGTMVRRGSLTSYKGTADLYGIMYGFAFDKGAYIDNYAGSPYPFVTIPYEDLAETIGLTAGKLVKGESILGITGTGTTGTNTSDATANSGDIRSGKTAYVNGSKVTGIAEMFDSWDSYCYGLLPVIKKFREMGVLTNQSVVYWYVARPGETVTHNDSISSYHSAYDNKIFDYNGSGNVAIPNYTWRSGSGISKSGSSFVCTNNDSVSNAAVMSYRNSSGIHYMVVILLV